MNSPRRPLTLPQALNRAAALCARSEQSAGDIREKLVKWGLNGNEVSQALAQLTEQGFIDNERYARAFVKDKFRFNGWGKIKISHQLRLKGVPDSAIGQAMKLIDEDAYRERLVQLLQAKWETVRDREPRAAWAAMMRFAASRGFETGIASECVRLVTRIDDQDD